MKKLILLTVSLMIVSLSYNVQAEEVGTNCSLVNNSTVSLIDLKPEPADIKKEKDSGVRTGV